MRRLVTGSVVGVLLVVVLSGLGILLARLMGGNVHEAVSQIYGAATIVLLVTIHSSLERLRQESRTEPQDH